MRLVIKQLDKPIFEGDWHDKPLKWTVIGPNSEVSNFVTKKNANLYARIRRRSANSNEAGEQYVREAN